VLKEKKMPKVSTGQIKTAAEAVFANWISRLGIKAAGKAQRLLGRLIREEKARRCGMVNWPA
jgi:hypothetical protein